MLGPPPSISQTDLETQNIEELLSGCIILSFVYVHITVCNTPDLCIMTLCLQLEVSQLEGSLQQPKAQSSMSPYLVPDTAALCQHLHLIRQLASSGCFIVIIPRTGTSLLKDLCTRSVPTPLPLGRPGHMLPEFPVWDYIKCNLILVTSPIGAHRHGSVPSPVSSTELRV